MRRSGVRSPSAPPKPARKSCYIISAVSTRLSLERRGEEARHGEGVEEDQLVAGLGAALPGSEAVAIEAGGKEPGLALLIGLIDGERRFDIDPVGIGCDKARQADQ